MFDDRNETETPSDGGDCNTLGQICIPHPEQEKDVAGKR